MEGLYHEPDAFCFTTADGGCESKDPRCMHQHFEVPFTPPEEMWDGLARDMMMWLDMNQGRPTPRTLFEHLKRAHTPIPQWLIDEPEMKNLDSVPSKGTRVVIIYKAMLDAHLQRRLKCSRSRHLSETSAHCYPTVVSVKVNS